MKKCSKRQIILWSIVISIFLLVLIPISNGYILNKKKCQLLYSLDSPEEPLSNTFSKCIKLYITESGDTNLNIGKEVHCKDTKSLFDGLIYGIKLDKDIYGPYLNKNIFEEGKKLGILDDTYRTKTMIELEQYWKIKIDKNSNEVFVYKGKGKNEIFTN